MTAGLIIKSILMGMDHALNKRDFAALEIESLPFKAAVEYMTKRMPLSKEEYYKKDNQAKFRAFTVSRIADGAILEKVKNILTENLKEKTGFSTFLKQTDSQILDAVGMGPGKAWYWETVYRTNVQTAYNVGRAIGFDVTKPLALEFVGLEDGRQTDICRHLSEAKIVLPYGDPFWATHTPPLYFGCRSILRAIYDPEELPEEFAPAPEGKDFTPAKGFGEAPLLSDKWWQELPSMKAQAVRYGVQGEVDSARGRLFSRNMANGQRRSIFTELTPRDKRLVRKAAKQLNIPTDIFYYPAPGTGVYQTGYYADFDKIVIAPDVFPSDDGSVINRDVMTMRAVLAHEYYGHYHFRNTRLPMGDARDEIRASYYAAIHAPNLSKVERMQLMQDVLDRASEKGIILNRTKKMKEILYGYDKTNEQE